MEDAKRRSRGEDASRSVRHALYDLELPSSDCILAALELWDWAGCRPGKLTVSASFIAGLVRLVDARSARRWIDAWAAAGLITILARDKRRGAYEIFLEDPRQVPRLRRHREDPQLFDDPDDGLDDDGADSGAHPCPPDPELGGQLRASVSAENSEAAATLKKVEPDQTATINELRSQLVALEARLAEKSEAQAPGLRPRYLVKNQTSKDLHLVDLGPRSLQANRADSGAPPTALADAMAEFLKRQPSPLELERAKKSLAEQIRERVDDPRLQPGPRFRAAEAVVAGYLPSEDLEAILAALDAHRRQQTLREPPFAFFVGALRQKFRELQIPWTNKLPTHSRDPPGREA